jgi:hypothetical protein
MGWAPFRQLMFPGFAMVEQRWNKWTKLAFRSACSGHATQSSAAKLLNHHRTPYGPAVIGRSKTSKIAYMPIAHAADDEKCREHQ